MGDHKSRIKGLPRMTVMGNPKRTAVQLAEGATNSDERQSEGWGIHSFKEVKPTDCFMCLNLLRGFRKLAEIWEYNL